MGDGEQQLQIFLDEDFGRARGIQRQQPNDLVAGPKRRTKRRANLHFLERPQQIGRIARLLNQHARAPVEHHVEHCPADPHLRVVGQPANRDRRGNAMLVEEAEHSAVGAGLLHHDREDFVQQLLRFKNPHQLLGDILNQPQLDFGQPIAAAAEQPGT